MKRIAVNTRFLLKDKLEGIGWFTHETLSRIVKAHPKVEFHFLFDRKYDESFIYADNVVPHVMQPPARHPFLWYAWFELSVKKKLKEIQPDVFLSTDGYGCLGTDIPQNIVIHDLAFEHNPEDLSKLIEKYYRYYTPKFADKASRITTVSQFSKKDIVERYGVDENKVSVVYNGVNEKYKSLVPAEVQKVREAYSGGEPYFLFIGALHPRKNIVRLLQAFDKFKDETGLTHKLVLVGRKGWGTKDIEEAFNHMKHQSDVVQTGRLSSDELANVLGGAFAMTYVPYLEGFGIPIIEGQKVGVPVITSNRTSMPEVGGKESSVLVDPFSVESIKEGMKIVATDEAKYDDLVLKGTQNASLYSWDRTAQLLWQSIVETV